MRSDATAVDCDDLMEALSEGDLSVLSVSFAAHVSQCLRCQAEAANYRRLRRSLQVAAAESPPEVPDLEGDILLALDRHDGRLARRVPGYAAATIGGLAAAAGVIALARQRRAAV